jgi:hypothetical protein
MPEPADLPVMQSSKFELVINAQTALMLGLTVPPTLLSVAERPVKFAAVHESAYGTKRTCQSCRSMSAFGGKAEN